MAVGDPVQPAFDDRHPPASDLLADCVHCGFCLPTCPTYQLWGQEMDSPRGRIVLMEQGVAGAPLSETMVAHFDRCLGCMACVTACPSGVEYDKLIGATRQQVARRHRRPGAERALRAAIFALFPYPRRLRLLRGPLRAYQGAGLSRLVRRSGFLRRLPASLRAMEEITPPIGRWVRLPARLPARGDRRAVVGLLTGCVQDAFFSDVNAATARVLAGIGCDVVVPRDQGCCGALSEHNGREAEAQEFARRLIEVFEREQVDYVVVNAAGCGSTMKDYSWLLRDDPAWQGRAEAFEKRTRDFSELVAALGVTAAMHPLPLKVAYHDACHLAHAQHIRTQPRAVLRAIPDLELLEIGEPDICCGSAGIYNLLQPDAARELGDRKADRVLAAGADVVVTANPGCLMQIVAATARLGHPVPVVHIATLFDASLRGRPAAALLVPGPTRPSKKGASHD